MVEEGGDNIVLEGANASAEGEDADDTEEGQKVRVLNLVRDFRLSEFPKLDKKAYMAHAKGAQIPGSLRIQEKLTAG